jgi:hypothetical protein
MRKTHKGSCHCGAVRWEADFDLAEGTGKCNCSICTKRRQWSARVEPEDFRLLSGGDNLTDYQFNTNSVHHVFCKTCGVASFGHGHIEQIGGAFYSINVACLDDATPAELLEGPIRYMNGRDNEWWHEPAETRHL